MRGGVYPGLVSTFASEDEEMDDREVEEVVIPEDVTEVAEEVVDAVVDELTEVLEETPEEASGSITRKTIVSSLQVPSAWHTRSRT